MIRKNCPICHSKDNKKIFQRDFSRMTEIMPFERYSVYECQECGFIYAGDIVESMPLSRYYDLCSKYSNESYNLDTASRQRFEIILKLFKERVPKDASILEIGCAEGFFLDMLRSDGYICIEGIEPSSQCVQYARDELGLNVIEGGLGNLKKLDNKKFDVIVSEQVLEHIVNPYTAIEEMTRYLADDGLLCIGVPDAGAFSDHIDFFRQFSSEHINYFSEGSLANLMRQNGFEKLCIVRNAEQGTLVSLWKSNHNGKQNVLYDYSGTEAVNRYVRANKEYAEELKQRAFQYDDVLVHDDGKNYNIWGAGTYTATLIQFGIISVANVTCIIDGNRNYQGHEILGRKVISPDEITNDNPILIAVYGKTKDSIRKEIKKRGLKNQIMEL